jgi:glycosyltransferase involved in cell wall biosynthesis
MPSSSRGDSTDPRDRVTPRASIIVPLYNLRRFVGEAIESALAQTLPADDIEVIVVDDGSTDGGGEFVKAYAPRVRYVRQANRGLCAARNAGIRVARAPYLGFLDADDRFLPEKLAAQLAVFDQRPEVGLVYTGFRYVDEHGEPLPQIGWTRLEGDVFPALVLGNLIHPHVALVRRDVVERAGGFDETLGPAGDWDFWLRISRPGLVWACVDRPLAEYRVRADAMHQDVTRMHRDCVRVLEKVFSDPTLPAAVADLRPRAYQRTHLVAACDHYRVGDRAAGTHWLHEAARLDASFLTDPASLRDLFRALLPLGYQRGVVVIDELPRLVRTLRLALADLFAAPDLEPQITRLRWRSRLALVHAVAPLARKRLKAVLRAGWRPRRNPEPA